MTSVNGQIYSWDDNGNLLNDGVNTYVYDQANRLASVTSNQSSVFSYTYNGLGDRLRQTVNGVTTTYANDYAAGLTQVLSDGTNSYLYGVGRLGQYDNTMQYFGADGLGSVRQIYNSAGIVQMNGRYDPFGNVMSANGTVTSVYGFTGEQTDETGLVYLRARYYDAGQGRFTTRDTWGGISSSPTTLNRWNYTEGNPVNFTDPSGYCTEKPTWREVVDCYQQRFADRVHRHNPLPGFSKTVINNLAEVQWHGIFDTDGLEGDWLYLTQIWFNNERPASLGVWGIEPEHNEPIVTITSQGYINDFKKHQGYAFALNTFGMTYRDFCKIKIGDNIVYNFVFTGPGSAGRAEFQEKYKAMEWFLGSHTYTLTVVGIDEALSRVLLNVEVLNRSHWESESRIPGSWKGKTLIPARDMFGIETPEVTVPGYLIPNWVGEDGRPGAAFWQRYLWLEFIQYPWVPRPINPSLPPLYKG